MVALNSNSARVQQMVYVLALYFLEKIELAHDFITYITTPVYTLRIFSQAGTLKQEYTCNIYKAGMCASAMCFCVDIQYMMYIYIVRLFLVQQKGE